MRIFKLGVISIIFLFLVTTAVSFLIPSQVRISKAINIYAEKDSLLPYLKDTSKWKQWHPAFMAQKDKSIIPSITIKEQSINDSEIIMSLQQYGKKPVLSGWKLFTHAAPGDSLTLQWYMDFTTSWYPWQKFGSLFYENSYGLLMQNGLENLRSIVQHTEK